MAKISSNQFKSVLVTKSANFYPMKIRQKAWKREIGFYVKSILEIFGVPKTALFTISQFYENHFSKNVQYFSAEMKKNKNSDFLNFVKMAKNWFHVKKIGSRKIHSTLWNM